MIDVLPDRGHFSLSIFWKRRERFGRDRIHFGNDPASVRLDHLRPIAEVDLVTVIVGRVMTRCDHDAGVRLEIANCK